MAQTELFLCPVCLDSLQTPVTLSCGHNYCLKCVQDHWDSEEEQRLYTCPECRVSFTPRPVLTKNILLEALLEQRRTAPPAVLCAGPAAPPADSCSGPQDLCSGPAAPPADPQDLGEPQDLADPRPGPQDVSCDVCSDRKLKAVQSCLQCVASFCERHLQPHYDSAVLQRHQLVAPSHTLQENMCSEHNELKKMFCRSDGQLLCLVCCLETHRDHETVSSASERALREAQLEAQRDLLLQNLQHKDTERTSLQQQEKDLRTSAHTALQLSRDSFRDIILLLETRAKEVEQQLQSELQRGLSRVREIQDRVKQELSELQQRLCDLDTLSLTKDHNSFIQLHTALSRGLTEGPVPVRGLTEGPVPVRGLTETRSPFEEVSRAVSKLKKRLQLTVEEGRSNISLALSPVQTLTTEPQTTEGFSLKPRPLRVAADTNSQKKLMDSCTHKKKSPRRRSKAQIYKPVLSSVSAAEPQTKAQIIKPVLSIVSAAEPQTKAQIIKPVLSIVSAAEPQTKAQIIKPVLSIVSAAEPQTKAQIIKPVLSIVSAAEPQTKAQFIKPVLSIVSAAEPQTKAQFIKPVLSIVSAAEPQTKAQFIKPVLSIVSAAEPRTRDQFLQYSTDFTLDTNTAHTWLSLSDGNRRVTRMIEDQKYPNHQDRFSVWPQVLSRESVSGRCYWEVERSSKDYVYITVSYRDIQRKGYSDECIFGKNNKSWALVCNQTSPSFWFNSVETKASGPVGSRVGVFLDHSAGVLSFYDVSSNMRLIHREQTTFSQPLHAGVGFLWCFLGATAHFSKLK